MFSRCCISVSMTHARASDTGRLFWTRAYSQGIPTLISTSSVTHPESPETVSPIAYCELTMSPPATCHSIAQWQATPYQTHEPGLPNCCLSYLICSDYEFALGPAKVSVSTSVLPSQRLGLRPRSNCNLGFAVCSLALVPVID